MLTYTFRRSGIGQNHQGVPYVDFATLSFISRLLERRRFLRYIQMIVTAPPHVAQTIAITTMAVIQAGVLLSSGHTFKEPLQIWSWQQNMFWSVPQSQLRTQDSPSHVILHTLACNLLWQQVPFLQSELYWHSSSPLLASREGLKRIKRGTKNVYQIMLGVSLLRRRSLQSQANLPPGTYFETNLSFSMPRPRKPRGSVGLQSAPGYSNRTGVALSSFYMKWFSSLIVVVAWFVQWLIQKKIYI